MPNVTGRTRILVAAHAIGAGLFLAGCGYAVDRGEIVRTGPDSGRTSDPAAGSSAQGVGYTFDRAGQFRTANSDDDRIRTVAIDMFETREFRRDLELQLTEALAKRINSDSPYRLVRKEFADTLLTGEIREVRQNTIGRDFRTVLPRETAATLVVAFQWKDLRNGEILVDRPNFVQTVDYTRRLDEDFYHAMQRATDRMAERIVESMEIDDW